MLPQQPSAPDPWRPGRKERFLCQGQSGSCSSSQIDFSEFLAFHELGSKLLKIVSGNSRQSDQKTLSLPGLRTSCSDEAWPPEGPTQATVLSRKRPVLCPVSVLEWPLSSEYVHSAVPLASGCSQGN